MGYVIGAIAGIALHFIIKFSVSAICDVVSSHKRKKSHDYNWTRKPEYAATGKQYFEQSTGYFDEDDCWHGPMDGDE